MGVFGLTPLMVRCSYPSFNCLQTYLNILMWVSYCLLMRDENYKIEVLPMKSTFSRALRVIKERGLAQTIQSTVNRSLVKYGYTKSPKQHIQQTINLYEQIATKKPISDYKGIAVVTSALEFEEVYNQRTINLAKDFAHKGYLVLYVVWQWEPAEKLQKAYQNVYENTYEIPLYDFYNTIDHLNIFEQAKEKLYFVTFPAPIFVSICDKLEYDMIYDMMDEWEEFHQTGQAPWYIKEVEEQCIVRASHVFAVSKPLVTKFAHLNTTIHVIGNGYNPALSGQKNIALKEALPDGKIHIGYFGHMTDSWFDWDLMFQLAKNEQLVLHFIGYGAPQHILDKMKGYANMHYYGKMHPSELQEQVKHWHIGMIPFKPSKLSEAVDPIKIYEYLYFGLPTVTSGIPHLNDYPFVTHCDTATAFEQTIVDYYEKRIHNQLNVAELEQFLHDTTWDERFATMERLILEKN